LVLVQIKTVPAFWEDAYSAWLSDSMPTHTTSLSGLHVIVKLQPSSSYALSLCLPPPDGMVVCHLPYGPTASSLSNTVMRHDIPNVGTMSEAYPHLIFHNFKTKLGVRVSLDYRARPISLTHWKLGAGCRQNFFFRHGPTPTSNEGENWSSSIN